jgi:hypothetical protein
MMAIFVPIDEACTAFIAGPKVRDSASNITNSRRTALNDMDERYLLMNWIARAASCRREGKSNFSVRHLD